MIYFSHVKGVRDGIKFTIILKHFKEQYFFNKTPTLKS